MSRAGRQVDGSATSLPFAVHPYGGPCRNPANASLEDTTGPVGPARCYIVAATPRTGSTLLCQALADRGVGVPMEYLNAMQIRDWEARTAPAVWVRWTHRALRGPAVHAAGRGWWSDQRLAGYLARIRARRTTADGWFGLKIHHHHLQAWFVRPGRDIGAVLAPRRWLWIRRRDRIAQAVSWFRALRSGRWASWQRPGRPVRYSHRAIARRLAAIEAAEAGWVRFFTRGSVVPEVLYYEDLVAAWPRTLARAYTALGAPPQPAPRPRLERLADRRSAAWVQRFAATEGYDTEGRC